MPLTKSVNFADMKQVVVDSSVFLSSLIPEDVFHTQSLDFFLFLERKKVPILIPILVLMEVMQVGYKRTKDPELLRSWMLTFTRLSEVRGLRILPLESMFFANFLKFHTSFPLETSDAIISVTAAMENLPLVSWDKQLVKASRPLVEAHTPAEFLALHRKRD